MSFKKKKSVKRSIRRSHVISTYGIGSIYQFKNKYSVQGESDSLMLAGLDEWFDNESRIYEEWKIYEPRLQSLLNKKYFVTPPDYRTQSESRLNFKSLPYVRFPNWHRCFSCGWMSKLSPYIFNPTCNSYEESEKNSAFKNCANNKVPKSLIPMRFVVVCKKGHIDDFPFYDWVHQEKKSNNPRSCQLKMMGGKQGNASLLGLKIKCVTCDTKPISLATFFSNKDDENPILSSYKKIDYQCTGRRPWLNDFENCKEKAPKIILRGASNSYYSVVKSSIFIPIITDQFNLRITNIINNQNKWEKIYEESKKEKNIFKQYITNIAEFSNVEVEELYQAVIKKIEGLSGQLKSTSQDMTEENYRFQEYDFILNKDAGDDAEMIKKKLPIQKYGVLADYFENIFLISRLLETRVQIGITRLLPYDEGMSSENIQKLSTKPYNWLPGMVVRGEGIFFEFNKKKIEIWKKNFNSKSILSINNNYNKNRKDRGMSIREINAKFVLIHTFAHLLINQLSYSCGYASASLRERIYCNLSDNDKEMQGVLIYTASGDAEGTLGGLVREGEPQNLKAIVIDAFNKAINCSYDPVCLETTSQGLGGTNASSCHACTFLAETSCEEGNQLLDRTAIIGNNSNLKGYFDRLIND